MSSRGNQSRPGRPLRSSREPSGGAPAKLLAHPCWQRQNCRRGLAYMQHVPKIPICMCISSRHDICDETARRVSGAHAELARMATLGCENNKDAGAEFIRCYSALLWSENSHRRENLKIDFVFTSHVLYAVPTRLKLISLKLSLEFNFQRQLNAQINKLYCK